MSVLQILPRLHEKGCISNEHVASARAARASLSVASRDEQFAAAIGAAILAIESKKAEEALQHLDEALEINPNNTAVWFDRGYALGTLGRYEEALASFDRALTPDDPAVWFYRGNVLYSLDRCEEALTSFDQALALTPDDPAAWANRGSTYLKLFTQHAEQDEVDSGRRYWKKALESGKRSADREWPDAITEALLQVAKSGRFVFIRQLIAESDLEEQLFPLARAIDYLQAGDAALIEKLSPEVKGIVEKVVETLRTVA